MGRYELLHITVHYIHFITSHLTSFHCITLQDKTKYNMPCRITPYHNIYRNVMGYHHAWPYGFKDFLMVLVSDFDRISNRNLWACQNHQKPRAFEKGTLW